MDDQSDSQNTSNKPKLVGTDIYPAPTQPSRLNSPKNSNSEESVERGPTITQSFSETVTVEDSDSSRHYIIKYVLTLVTGWALVGILAGLFGVIIDHLFHLDEYSKEAISSWSASSLGSLYALLISAAIVFGTAHIGLNRWAESDHTSPNSKQARVTHVLSIIFASSLLLSALSCIIAFIFPIIGKTFGFINATPKEIAEVSIIALVSLIITVGMAFYHIRAIKLLNLRTFSGIYALLTVLAIILFTFLPAGRIREAVHDAGLISDLDKIVTEIETYVEDNGQLPDELSDLKPKDLNFSLNTYSYTQKKSGSSSWSSRNTLEYEICAKGFKTDTSENSYGSSSFYYHGKGEECFDQYAYGSSDPVYNYKDDYVY